MFVQTFVSPLSHFDASSVLESLALPIIVLDGECCVVFVNATARTLLRIGLRDLQGKPLDLLFMDGGTLRRAFSLLLSTESETPCKPLRVAVRELASPGRDLVLKAHPIEDELTGTHLLVQLARRRQRKIQPVLQRLAAPPQHLECA